MTKKIAGSMKVALVSLVGMAMLSGCGGKEAQIKPWGKSVLNNIEFSFKDIDKDKGEIEGDLILRLKASEKISGVTDYVIYWSDSASKSGKGDELAEVSANISDDLLYRVPQDTFVPEEKGEYFLLYIKGEGSSEIFSGKSIRVEDLFEPEKDQTSAQNVEASADTPEQPDVEQNPNAEVAPDTPAAPEEPVAVTSDTPSDVEPTTIVIENVLFEFDRSSLRPEYRRSLRETFASVKDKGSMKLLIAGHADERGSNEYNLVLGEKRAYAVKRYLVSLGFAVDNIKIISYGEEKPVELGHDEEAWEKNRRAEADIQE